MRIELRDLSLEVGKRRLLRDIDARISAGEFVAVLGRNGAGKTTLLRAIAGLHPPAAGAVTIDGVPSAHLGGLERARRIAFVTGDEVFLEALLVRDVVSIGRFPHQRPLQWRPTAADDAAIEAAMAAVRVGRFAGRLFSTLSAGERQRVWIAMGLAQETPILLLDEPTSHLDVAVAHEILALLRRLVEHGKTVVCALHDVNEAAAYADRVALLGDGTLLAVAPPDEVLPGPLLERAYGIAFAREPAILPVRRLQGPHVRAQHPTRDAP